LKFIQVNKWLVDDDDGPGSIIIDELGVSISLEVISLLITLPDTSPWETAFESVYIPEKNVDLKTLLAQVTEKTVTRVRCANFDVLLPWTPTSTHFNTSDLKIPASNNSRPQLLFHGLGTRTDDRVAGLRSNQYTYVLLMRLTLFLIRFGLYSTCRPINVEGFGSKDHEDAVAKIQSQIRVSDLSSLDDPEQKKALDEENTAIVERHTDTLILSHLLVLQTFFKALPPNRTMFHYRLWLLAQTHPTLLFGFDVFAAIAMV
jgi:hypothetical protein